MITVSNQNFSVSLLDPREDRDKLGSRYCAGGYIWQIYDKDGRALLSGPRYPDKSPPVFDGQGMPEVFETPLGGGDDPVGADVCVIGVGLVKKSSDIEPFHPRNNPHVTLPCTWNIEHGDDRAAMVTVQSFGDKSIKLSREVRVDNNIIKSINTVDNIGGSDVTLRWFSHPFFPLNPDLTCGKIAPRIKLPDSLGYNMEDDGIIRMNPDYPWEKGLFQVLEAPHEKLNFTIRHPILESVNFQTDYNVIRCALWANSQTFSFEPFMQNVIKPSETVSWGVTMSF